MAIIRLAGGLLVVLLLTLAFHPGSSPVGAGIAGFVVDTSLDDPDNSTADGLCDTGENKCSLRAAIQQLNALGGNHTITVPAGLYQLSWGASGEDAAAGGDLDLTAASLTINGAGSASTTIQRGSGNHRIFDIVAGNHTITGFTIQNGQGDGADGGGIRVGSGGTLGLDSVLVTGNQSATGVGGGVSVQGTLQVSRSTISSNTAPGVAGDGGGVQVWNSATATFSDSTVSGNTAGNLGGGISNDMGSVTVTGSTISGNSAGALDLGGGIRNRGLLTVTNSTVSGNSANDGGGLSNIDPGTASVSNTTIANNTGGGIIVSGTFSMANSILANVGNFNCNNLGGFSSLGYNIDSGNTCGLNGAGDLVNTDPALGALGNNGGPTQTHSPLPGSPAVDVGSPVAPGSGGTSCAVKDQRQSNRPVDGNGDLTVRCDIGAVEACPAAPDGDGDFVGDACDNCPAGSNAGQEDYDGDNAGNACEALGGGNVDCSDAVNSVDALKVLRHGAALSVNQEEPCQNIGLALFVGGLMGDVDCSGAVNAVDALKIQRAVAALPVSQAPGCPAVIVFKP